MRGRLSARDAERRRTRFRLLGFTLLFVFAAALIWGRCVLSEERQSETLAEAASALDSALGGEEASWALAEKRYAKASRASILDPYPLWVVEIIAAWRSERVASSEPKLSAILTRVRAREYAQARRLAETLDPSKAREFLLRLIDELTRVKGL